MKQTMMEVGTVIYSALCFRHFFIMWLRLKHVQVQVSLCKSESDNEITDIFIGTAQKERGPDNINKNGEIA